MTTKQTVLIVGAGANSELGLPTGVGLMDAIARDALFSPKDGTQRSDQKLYDLLLRLFADERKKNPEELGRELSATIGGGAFGSIDEVLHYHSKTRPDIVDIGKLLIVYEIVKAERESKLYWGKRPSEAHITNTQDTWLPILLNWVVSGSTRDSIESAFEKVTIIDFNYDRAILHYLQRALTKRARLGQDSQALCKKIQIIKPYGCIAPLPWSGDLGLSYGGLEDLSEKNIRSFAAQIQTFTEQNRDEKLQGEIAEALQSAKLIVILGFGFHKQNIELLSREVGPTTNARIFSTAYRLHNENVAHIAAMLIEAMKVSIAPKLLNMTARELLHELRPSLLQLSN